MNYIVVTTPENIEIEYRLAGAGSRLAAAVVDMAIQFIAFTLLAVTAFFTVFSYGLSDLIQLNLSGWFVAFIIISYFVIYFGYFIAGELLMNGQSPGKRLFKLRVIRENGMPAGFIHSLVRNLIRYFIDFTGIGLITIMFSKKCKRLGDMAASTIVIAENPSQIKMHSITSDSLQNNNFNYSLNISSDITLNDDERYLINEFFDRRQGFLDGGAELERKLKAYICKKYDYPEDWEPMSIG